MKNLTNIGKPVPEPADPPLIKPVTDVLEEIDAILGAPVGDLDTSDQTVVGAINELVDAIEANATNISLQNLNDQVTPGTGLALTKAVHVYLLNVVLNKIVPTATWTYLATISAGHRPLFGVHTAVVSDSGNIGWLQVDAAGAISVFFPAGASQVIGQVSWMA